MGQGWLPVDGFRWCVRLTPRSPSPLCPPLGCSSASVCVPTPLRSCSSPLQPGVLSLVNVGREFVVVSAASLACSMASHLAPGSEGRILRSSAWQSLCKDSLGGVPFGAIAGAGCRAILLHSPQITKRRNGSASVHANNGPGPRTRLSPDLSAFARLYPPLRNVRGERGLEVTQCRLQGLRVKAVLRERIAMLPVDICFLAQRRTRRE